MDDQYLQNIRYKLQKRFSRVNSARHEIYLSVLRQFWQYINSFPLFVGIMEDLVVKRPKAKDDAAKIISKEEVLVAEDEIEAAAISLWVLKGCCGPENDIVLQIAWAYGNVEDYEDAYRLFTDLFVEPLYEYLNEQLDERGAVLSLLVKYKQKAEWFQRDHLYQQWKNDKLHGEKRLAMSLYEYLHEQGVEFYIEPSSISGEVDIISAQEGDERLLADAKIFNPEENHGRDYIARGFKQLYIYALDFNEPVGYLILFNTSDKDLRLIVSSDSQSFPFVIFNHKTIYLVTIDIFPHEKPASKRGRIKPYDITEEHLIGAIESSAEK